MVEYDMRAGLEVHVELSTDTKMFCGCPTRFGDPPNTNVCPVCLGLPGAFPRPNAKAVELGVRAALAINCQVNLTSEFFRKNYFYPDLPKGYQITQGDRPLAEHGYIDIGRRIRVRRLHLEEDTGKSSHSGGDIITASHTLLDFNRCGVPLAEIVSEPDIETPEEARLYLEKLQRTLAFARVSDVKMEEGSMRVDCNISVSPKGSGELGTPVEVKNLSSFRAVVRALSYEFDRQCKLLREGKEISQETRHWDEAKGVTVAMRQKGTRMDYRYLPEPDLPLLVLDQLFVDEVKGSMPELPGAIATRYMEDLGLSDYDADLLTSDRHLSAYYDRCVEEGCDPKTAANWIMGDLTGYMNEQGLAYDEIPLSPENLASLLRLLEKGTISGKIAKELLVEVIQTGRDPALIVKEKGLEQVSDESVLLEVIDRVIEENPEVVADILGGKDKAIGFLVGKVMKETRGMANPGKVNIMLRKKILTS